MSAPHNLARPAGAAPEVARGGAATTVLINGKPVQAIWELVESDALEATLSKADNQYRDRLRTASQVQISQIAKTPLFAMLSKAPVMDYGAPSIASDGRTIIGGNGRFAALVRAYADGTADQYRAELVAGASRFGLSAAGMARPVLVRRFTEELDLKAAAIASNEGGALRLSALEQAKIDAERMGDLSGFWAGEQGEVATAANRRFVQRFLAAMPATQQAALVDAGGQLSQEGLLRIRNAVLFKAYGDSPTLARMVESTDQGLRNIVAALLRAAPKIADARARMASGDLHELDITDQLLAAVEQLNVLRERGTPVQEYLDQLGLFGDTVSDEIAAILRYMDASARSAKAIAEFLCAYYDTVMAIGSPKQDNMFGAAALPTRREIIDANARPASRADSVQPTGAAHAGADSQTRPDTPGQPADSRRPARGDGAVLAEGLRPRAAPGAPAGGQPAIGKICFADAMLGASHGQTDHILQATVGDEPVGILEYSVFRGVPKITMLHVATSCRRRGYGAALAMELQRKFPGIEISWGSLTRDAAGLYRSLSKQTVAEPETLAKQAELAEVRARLLRLDQAAQAFRALPNPTSRQHAQFDRVLQPCNDLHDRAHDLAEELLDAKPTKTLLCVDAPLPAHDGVTAAKRPPPDALARIEQLRRAVRAAVAAAGAGAPSDQHRLTDFWREAQRCFGAGGAAALAELAALEGPGCCAQEAADTPAGPAARFGARGRA